MPGGDEPSGKPILIVVTGDPVPDVAARRGTYATLIEETIADAWTGDYRTVDPRKSGAGSALPRPDSIAGVVISGSAANLPNQEPWMLELEDWLRRAHERETPIYGICFGHQLLGEALGGRVAANPRGREIGTVTISRLVDDPLFEGVDASFAANATHVDSVIELPPGATVLAQSELESHQAIRFSASCYGVQFHPEIDADVMHGYLDARRELLSSENIDVAAKKSETTDAPHSVRTLRNFVRQVIVPRATLSKAALSKATAKR